MEKCNKHILPVIFVFEDLLCEKAAVPAVL